MLIKTNIWATWFVLTILMIVMWANETNQLTRSLNTRAISIIMKFSQTLLASKIVLLKLCAHRRMLSTFNWLSVFQYYLNKQINWKLRIMIGFSWSLKRTSMVQCVFPDCLSQSSRIWRLIRKLYACGLCRRAVLLPHTKFRRNRTIARWVMAKKAIFKMAVAAILNFKNFNFGSSDCKQVQHLL